MRRNRQETMLRCRTCGQDALLEDEYCRDCGHSLYGRCPYCATERPRMEENCPTCGAPWPDVEAIRAKSREETRRVPDMVPPPPAVDDLQPAPGVDEIHHDLRFAFEDEDPTFEWEPEPDEGEIVKIIQPTAPSAPTFDLTWRAEAALGDATAAGAMEEPEARPIGAWAEAWSHDEELAQATFLAEDAMPSEDGVWLERRRRRSPMLAFVTGLAVILLLAATSVGIWAILRSDPPPAAAPTTVPAASPTTQPAETTTTAVETTTTMATTTTAPPYIEPQGEAIPVDQLRLKTASIGDLEIGSPADQILPRLAASLGQPNEDSGVIASDGSHGACPGAQVRLVRWGPLMSVSTVADDGTQTFGGYRLDRSYLREGETSPASGLQTLSGLKLGDTVETLQGIYDDLVVEFRDDADLGTVYEVKNSAGIVLIWGPVTSSEPSGEVTGIYSPDSCPEP